MPKPEFHDALILKQPHLVRFPHDANSSDFTTPAQDVPPGDPGYRKVQNLAEADGDYMAVATLPIRDEPESSDFCCYLFNSRRLYFPTSWSGGASRSDDLTIVNAVKAFRYPYTGPGPADYAKPFEVMGAARAALDDLVKGKPSDAYTMAIGLVPRKDDGLPHGMILNAPEVNFDNPWTCRDLFDAHAALTSDAVPPIELLLGVRNRKVLRVSTLGGQPTVSNDTSAETVAALEAGVALGGVKIDGSDIPIANLECFGVNWEPLGDLILATADGSVVKITIAAGGAHSVARVLPSDSAYPQVWNLLRNGCIAGVLDLGHPVPLLNLSGFLKVNKRPDDVGQPTKEPDFEGTYDFKWKSGTTLTVAIAKPASMGTVQFAQVRKTICETASQWTQTGANIKLQFMDAPLDPKTHYDIWVDLTDLPIENGFNGLTSSRLGRYARRLGFGKPTMYLGQMKNLIIPGGVDYWDSSAFKHFILHEFGHALGLPHLHQYEGLLNEIKTDTGNQIHTMFLDNGPAVAALVDQAMGIKLSSTTIVEEILRPLRVNERFCDWPPKAAFGRRGGATVLDSVANESIMAGLPIPKLRANAVPGGAMAKAEYWTELGEIDKAWIVQLYP